MHMTARMTMFAVLMVALVSMSTPVLAQDTVEGEVVRVDSEQMTLAIRTPEGERAFAYTPQTEVVGAEEGVAGLAAVAGHHIVVEFVASRTAGELATATRIEVRS